MLVFQVCFVSNCSKIKYANWRSDYSESLFGALNTYFHQNDYLMFNLRSAPCEGDCCPKNEN